MHAVIRYRSCDEKNCSFGGLDRQATDNLLERRSVLQLPEQGDSVLWQHETV
jgi:hypothetical protein